MTALDKMIMDLRVKAERALQDYHERLEVIKELIKINDNLKK